MGLHLPFSGNEKPRQQGRASKTWLLLKQALSPLVVWPVGDGNEAMARYSRLAVLCP